MGSVYTDSGCMRRPGPGRSFALTVASGKSQEILFPLYPMFPTCLSSASPGYMEFGLVNLVLKGSCSSYV